LALPQRRTVLPLVNREVSGALFDRLIVGAVGLGFLLVFLAGVASLNALAKSREFAGLVTHTQEVQGAIARVAVLAERTESARRGYLLTGGSSFGAVMQQVESELVPSVAKVEALTRDNLRQQNRIATIRDLIAQKDAAWDREAALLRRQDAAAAQQLFAGEGARLIRAIRATADAMVAEEEKLLAERMRDQARAGVAVYAVLGLTGLLLVLVGAGSIFIILRYTHDLSASRDRLRDLNAGLEDMVKERTADLTRANDEIQRFAYIVSHDLRSPLVNVMGFTAELSQAIGPLQEMLKKADAEAPQVVSKDARAAVEADLPEAIGFIRTSTQKMDRLINAILRLSREGRRVITPEPLEVAQLVEGVRASIKHQLDDLGAQVNVEGPLPTIVSDRLALEQILSNLIENGVKYGAPGRPPVVTVRGRTELGRAIFEIQDNGRGIDPKDHERVFELFRRSGVQDKPGEGIGLAHVRALAYRLGGTVDCQSALDQGATFRLSVPQKITSEQAAGRD
jgi:signal transduction histidine kinase